MAQFSKDVDLLKREPVLFGELALASQRLCQGDDGVLSGTTLTSSSAAFDEAQVSVGHVIRLRTDDGEIDGCYEIVSVDSGTELTVSVVRQTSDDAAVAPPGGSGISYRVSTFDPQAEETAYSLLQYFGIDDDDAGSPGIEDIVNERALRQASVFGVLGAVFAASATGKEDSAGMWEKSLWYQKLFNAARAKARLKLDTDNDEAVDEFRSGGSVRLKRL